MTLSWCAWVSVATKHVLATHIVKGNRKRSSERVCMNSIGLPYTLETLFSLLQDLDALAATGPTSFAGVRRMVAAAAAAKKPKRKLASPALLGMLSRPANGKADRMAGEGGQQKARAGGDMSWLTGAEPGSKRAKGSHERALNSLFRKPLVPSS